MTAKQRIISILQSMPDDATSEEIYIDLQTLKSLEQTHDQSKWHTSDDVRRSTTQSIEKAKVDSKKTAQG